MSEQDETQAESSASGGLGFRKAQTEFHRRGEAAWQDYLRTGIAIPAEEVLRKLEDKLNAKRRQLSGQ